MIQLKILHMLLLALSLPGRRCLVSAFRPALSNQWSSNRLFSTREESSKDEETSTSDPLEKYRNKNNIRDQVFSCISSDGGVKVTVATIRNIVNDMSLQHTMTAVPTDALGRTVTCALLMSNGMQLEQTVQITMNGRSMYTLSAKRD